MSLEQGMYAGFLLAIVGGIVASAISTFIM